MLFEDYFYYSIRFSYSLSLSSADFGIEENYYSKRSTSYYYYGGISTS